MTNWYTPPVNSWNNCSTYLPCSINSHLTGMILFMYLCNLLTVNFREYWPRKRVSPKCLTGLDTLQSNFLNTYVADIWMLGKFSARLERTLDCKCLEGISSVQFSLSVVSHSLRPHGLQHTRSPCLSPTPGAYSISCSSHQWCHPIISSSVVPFPFRLQSFPASGSFPVSQFFASGGQTIGVSASATVLPMNIQDWFPLGWTGWISLQSKGLSRVFSNTTVQKHQFFGTQLSLWYNSHIHIWLLEKS